ncbi:hypothetical protein N7509_011273 [Penicillium cosmopolitanum]|uniref:Ubiquitin-activating enzyme E1-like n=1 Tax=Penicillium cosmopolitanum TaxID=1131564 RepID=A0A9X0B5G6_9EURO|nr:uncharacterized protein N7509_011273 [Penicillium cosmopolitanum]KAJ5388732.1 hypothetical protein N7509_011273 [Penicillium cosmopolitanum]
MRPSSIKRCLGVDLAHQIQESRVLLVGAGGIGCELLKNLVLTGFGDIHIIDLDTIDLSNLNRQFLFRHEHIKKPKALVRHPTSQTPFRSLARSPLSPASCAQNFSCRYEHILIIQIWIQVAKEVAQKFQPSAKLEAHHANIMDRQFNIDWFKGFNVVFNALDNLAARRHVNHMCLAAGVPLIESGTTGFNGQVQVIKKGETECYDCNEKETPKTFPFCTIRGSPTQPIHCIVWAKSWLMPELFGESEEDSDVIDSTENAENADEIARLKKEALELKKIRESMGSDKFFHLVFEKVFKLDLERLRGMEDMWKERQPPDTLDYDKLESESAQLEPTISELSQKDWSVEENFVVFKDSVDRLRKRLIELQSNWDTSKGTQPILSFDKDDEDTLDFVTAAANLRSTAFHIERKTKFDTKQMAGNIIPAIATTNAMTAGFSSKDQAQEQLIPILLTPPNPVAQYVLLCTAELLRSELDYGEEFSILNHGKNGQGEVVYDPDLEDNLSKKLRDITNNLDYITIVDEDDVDQDPRVNLELFFVERTEASPEESKPVTLQQGLEIPRKPKKVITPSFEDTPTTNGTSGPGKRKRDGEDEEMTNGHVAKKVAGDQANGDGEEVIVLDEEDGDSTKSAINVEYAVISVLVLCEEDRRIRHLSRISESM